jgi:hypothetical protein
MAYFSYNTGSRISGTDKFGNLSVSGDSSINYHERYGGVRWWNGPDERRNGYFIGYSRENLSEPGFRITSTKDDAGFLSLFNDIRTRAGLTTFDQADLAKMWLNSNGYWTNWPETTNMLVKLDASQYASYPQSGNSWVDLTGNGNNGSFVEGTGTITFSDNSGGILNINGSNGSGTRIVLADSNDISLFTTSYKTFNIWVRVDNPASEIIPILQKGTPASAYDGYTLNWQTDDTLRFQTNGSSLVSNLDTSNTFTKGNWYMITLVCKISNDNNTKKIYVNGSLEVQGKHGNDTIGDSADLFIGDNFFGSVNLDGPVGSFYSFAGELTSAQISNLFDATKTRFGY